MVHREYCIISPRESIYMIVYRNKSYLKGWVLPPFEILDRSCKLKFLFLLRQAEASKNLVQNSTGCSILLLNSKHMCCILDQLLVIISKCFLYISYQIWLGIVIRNLLPNEMKDLHFLRTNN